MRNKLYKVLLVILIPICLLADEEIEKIEPGRYFLNVSLVHPISFNKTAEDRIYINLNIAYGRVGSVTGIDLGLGLSAVRHDMSGVQVNGLASIVGENLRGLQMSGIFAVAGDNSWGLQSSGIVGVVGNQFTGVQASGIFSVVGDGFTGVQFAGLFALVGDHFKGVQAAGLFNAVGERFRGVQLGLFNIIGEQSFGGQLGLCNIAGENHMGFQIGGFNLVGARLWGFQVGIINFADELHGLQLGLVNVKRSRRGIPVGPLNLSPNGNIRWITWASNVMAVNSGLKFTVGKIYSILCLSGINLNEDINHSIGYGLYYGIHLTFDKYYIAGDIGCQYSDNYPTFKFFEKGVDQHLYSARVTFGFNLIGKLSLFVGGGIGVKYYHGQDTGGGKTIGIFFAGIELLEFNIISNRNEY